MVSLRSVFDECGAFGDSDFLVGFYESSKEAATLPGLLIPIFNQRFLWAKV